MEALLLLPDMPGYERFLKKWCPLMYADIQKKIYLCRIMGTSLRVAVSRVLDFDKQIQLI